MNKNAVIILNATQENGLRQKNFNKYNPSRKPTKKVFPQGNVYIM